jgi:hypothetical protein
MDMTGSSTEPFDIQYLRMFQEAYSCATLAIDNIEAANNFWTCRRPVDFAADHDQFVDSDATEPDGQWDRRPPPLFLPLPEKVHTGAAAAAAPQL